MWDVVSLVSELFDASQVSLSTWVLVVIALGWAGFALLILVSILERRK